MKFTATAATGIKAWIAAAASPSRPHEAPIVAFRRIGHLLKLCMVASMSRRCDRIITLEDYSEALNWLIEAESFMPDIFKSMQSGGDSSAMEEAWNYV